MSQNLRKEEYVHYLIRLHSLVTAWEQTAREHAPAWLVTELEIRSRLQMLQRDLLWFGATADLSVRPELPLLNDHPSLLGAMYVMEGSSLGGRYIARHVEQTLGLEAGNGNCYFRGHTHDTDALWQGFCSLLQAHLSDADTEAVVLGARAMFQAFGSWISTGGPVPLLLPGRPL